MIPGHAFKGFPATMMRYMLGDAAADVVGVPTDDWTARLTDGLCRLFHIETADAERSRVISRVAGAFSHALLTGFVWAERGGHRGQFTIPIGCTRLGVCQSPWGSTASCSNRRRPQARLMRHSG